MLGVILLGLEAAGQWIQQVGSGNRWPEGNHAHDSGEDVLF